MKFSIYLDWMILKLFKYFHYFSIPCVSWILRRGFSLTLTEVSARLAALGRPIGRPYHLGLFWLLLAASASLAKFNDWGWAKWVRLCWFGGKRLCALRQNRMFCMECFLFCDNGVLKMEGKGKAKRKNNAPTSCMRCMGPRSHSIARYSFLRFLLSIYRFDNT